MRWVLICLLPSATQAESLVATRMIAARSVLTTADVMPVAADIPGAVQIVGDAVGKELRRALRPGQAILERDLAPPVIVDRNARVLMRYNVGGLEIMAEGRALDDGKVGASIRVMSLSSRSVVSARVIDDGSVMVEGR